MAALVFRILGRAVLTLLLLTACVFFVLHLTGDPARLMLGSDASAEAIAAFRHQWGLDKPLWEQFGIYLLNALSLDMGKSYATGLPVKDVFLQALGPTLDLMIPTAIVTRSLCRPASQYDGRSSHDGGFCHGLRRSELLHGHFASACFFDLARLATLIRQRNCSSLHHADHHDGNYRSGDFLALRP
jgi:hypothetical protein